MTKYSFLSYKQAKIPPSSLSSSWF